LIPNFSRVRESPGEEGFSCYFKGFIAFKREDPIPGFFSEMRRGRILID